MPMLELPTQERRWWVVGVIIATALLGIGMVAVAFWIYLTPLHESSSPTPPFPTALDPSRSDIPMLQRPTPQPTPTPDDVVVYISGEVHHPDVYRMPFDARVKDVVIAAGGLTDDAAHDRINLAARIRDEQQIHIPRIEEVSISYDSEPSIHNPVAAAAEPRPININHASATELQTLPGIGPALAQRIIDYRTTNGPFPSVQDIQKVSGISPSLSENLNPLITVTE